MPRDTIVNVPELNSALKHCADSFILVPAPAVDGTPMKWLPCENCYNSIAVPRNVVSTVCDDCANELYGEKGEP